MERLRRLLDFWFGGVDEKIPLTSHSPVVKRWFVSDEKVVSEIRETFEGDLIRARKGKYEAWQDSPEGRLGLILLFDQVPRYVYPHSPKAFENDLRALEYCFLTIKSRWDEKIDPVKRVFLYLPLMHAENLTIQKQSLDYLGKLSKAAEKRDDKNFDYFEYILDLAYEHYDVIKQFGRFPFRNIILGRNSSPQELEYLQQMQQMKV